MCRRPMCQRPSWVKETLVIITIIIIIIIIVGSGGGGGGGGSGGGGGKYGGGGGSDSGVVVSVAVSGSGVVGSVAVSGSGPSTSTRNAMVLSPAGSANVPLQPACPPELKVGTPAHTSSYQTTGVVPGDAWPAGRDTLPAFSLPASRLNIP